MGVIALVLSGVAYVLRRVSTARRFGFKGRKVITLMETTMLSNTSALHVVRIADTYYVFSGNGEQVRLVRPLEAAEVEGRM